MGKSDEGDGVSLPSEFKETVRRIRDKEPELETLIERDQRSTPSQEQEDRKPDGTIDQELEQEGET